MSVLMALATASGMPPYTLSASARGGWTGDPTGGLELRLDGRWFIRARGWVFPGHSDAIHEAVAREDERMGLRGGLPAQGWLGRAGSLEVAIQPIPMFRIGLLLHSERVFTREANDYLWSHAQGPRVVGHTRFGPQMNWVIPLGALDVGFLARTTVPILKNTPNENALGFSPLDPIEEYVHHHHTATLETRYRLPEGWTLDLDLGVATYGRSRALLFQQADPARWVPTVIFGFGWTEPWTRARDKKDANRRFRPAGPSSHRGPAAERTRPLPAL